jgi:pimeloyl-ACP methyl ester carboxylesterase
METLAPVPFSYTSFDGLTLRAFRYGSDTAPLKVLCMHGLTRNHKDFEPLIEILQQRSDLDCQFIAIDTRGRGESQYDENTRNYIPPVYVRDVLTLLDELGIDKLALIGTSMGGIMSMLMMPLIGNRALGVVMNDIGPVVEPVGLRRIGNYVGDNKPLPDFSAAVAAVAKRNSHVFPKFVDEDWQQFARRTCREQKDGTVMLDYDPRLVESFSTAPVTALTRFYSWRLFARMRRCPLLLIRGQHSDLLSDRVAQRMIRRHGNGKLVTVPDVGHAPILNEPEATTAIGDFLASL